MTVIDGVAILAAGGWRDGPLVLDGDRIAPRAGSRRARRVDLESERLVALPGLVNGHDHLDFGGFPLLARHAPYADHRTWTDDVTAWRATGVVRTHQRAPLARRILASVLRNLLSGVTSVAHMNPLPRGLAAMDLPIRVLGGGRFFHSIPYGGDLARFLRRMRGRTFQIHVAEGRTARVREELDALQAAGGLGKSSILIHGNALDEERARSVARSGATLVLCPASNLTLYGHAPDAAMLAAAGVPLGLGSDSPISGPGDLLLDLAELRRSGLPEAACWDAVTRIPARAFGHPELGSLAPGHPADVVLADASDVQLRAGRRSVVAVIAGGRPVLSRRQGLLAALGVPETPFGEGLWLARPLARRLARAGTGS